MSEGNAQLRVRMGDEDLGRYEAMKAQGHALAPLLAAVAAAWAALGWPSPEDFLAAVQAVGSAADAEADLDERLHGIRSREARVAHREREVAKREQEAEARESRVVALEARSQLRRQVIDAGEAALRAGAKAEDVHATLRALVASGLRPEDVAGYIEKMSGVATALAEWTKHRDEQQKQADAQAARLDGLRAEVHTLEAKKRTLQAEIRGGVEEAVQATLARLEPAVRRVETVTREAETRTARLRGATEQATAAAQALQVASQGLARGMADAFIENVLTPHEPTLTRLAEMGVLVGALDGTATVDRVAVAGMILEPLEAQDYDARQVLEQTRWYVNRLRGVKVRERTTVEVAS